MKAKEVFAPYDRCDYRCDTCIHTRNCELFQQEIDTEVMTEDPDTDENPFTLVKRDIWDNWQSLQLKARKMGIRIEEPPEVDVPEYPAPETFDLYQLAYKFTDKSHQFLAEYWHSRPAEEELENLQTELEDLSWHHALVSVKLARALTSQYDGDPFGLMDAKISAEVALRCLRFCRLAIGNILSQYPDYFDWLIDLIFLTDKIEKEIFAQFGNILNEE